MAISSSFLSPFLALLLLHALILPHLAVADVEQTCAEAARSYPRLRYSYCVASLRRHRDSATADAWRLAQIAAELAVSSSDDAKEEIENLMKQEADPTVTQLLAGCSSLFDEMGRADARADGEIRARRYSNAKGLLDNGMALVRQCEASFSAAGKTSPLTRFATDALDLSVLCYAIIGLLN